MRRYRKPPRVQLNGVQPPRGAVDAPAPAGSEEERGGRRRGERSYFSAATVFVSYEVKLLQISEAGEEGGYRSFGNRVNAHLRTAGRTGPVPFPKLGVKEFGSFYPLNMIHLPSY